jgi:sporulation protein YlmC with PRC-barrel domain
VLRVRVNYAGKNILEEKEVSMDGKRVISPKTLKGFDVVNKEGEDLGNIEDIMIDVTTGKIVYAVLSFGGFLGIGDKLFAIPWGELKFSKDKLVLDVEKEKLSKAPGIDKNNWPDSPDKQYISDVYDYYGHPYFWEENLD